MGSRRREPGGVGTVTLLHLTPEQIGQRADAYEAQYGLPHGYLRTTLNLESSGGRNRATSRAGAGSIAQIMPGTARQYGFDPAELQANDDTAIRAAATIAQDNARHFGNDPVLMGIAYNAGPRYAQQFQRDHDVSALPAETQNYIRAFAAVQPFISPCARGADPCPPLYAGMLCCATSHG